MTGELCPQGLAPVVDARQGVWDSDLLALHELQQQRGCLRPDDYTAVCVKLGIKPRRVRQLLAEIRGGSMSVAPPSFELTQQHVEVYMACQGRATIAYEMLTAAGHPLPSYETFVRAIRESGSQLRQFARHGAEGLGAYSLYAPWEAPHRNHTWQIDHFEAPNDVIPRGYTVAKLKPWMTLAVDEATRLAVAAGVTAQVNRRGDAVSVCATVADGIRVRQIDGVDVGGVPLYLRCDNDKSFLAGVVVDLGQRVGFEVNPVAPYSGHKKGKIERLGRTVQEQFCLMQPAYSHGPTTAHAKAPFRDTPALGAVEYERRLRQWLYEYNTRVHSSLGCTPLEAWERDTTPFRVAQPEQLRVGLLVDPVRRKVIQRKGVHFEGRYWQSAALAALIDRKVEIHYPIANVDFIEIFYEGKWHSTAWPASELTRAQRNDQLQQRSDTYRRLRATQQAAVRLRTAAQPDETDATVTVAPAPIADDLAADEQDLYDLLAAEDGIDATGDGT